MQRSDPTEIPHIILSAADMWLLGAIIPHAIKNRLLFFMAKDRIDMDRETFY